MSWQAPKALRTDMKAPGPDGALRLDIATGGVGETDVLKPSCLGCGPGSQPAGLRRREAGGRWSELLGQLG